MTFDSLFYLFEDGVYKNDQSWSKIMKDCFLAWKLANFMVETIFFRGVCAHSADECGPWWNKEPTRGSASRVNIVSFISQCWAKTDSWLKFYVCCIYVYWLIWYYIKLHDIIFLYIYIVIYVHVDMQYKGSFQLWSPKRRSHPAGAALVRPSAAEKSGIRCSKSQGRSGRAWWPFFGERHWSW